MLPAPKGMSNTQATQDPANSPVAWFVQLEIAREASDFQQAAHAIQELKRLGVIVKFSKPRGANHGQ
jgi:hypothetical protein